MNFKLWNLETLLPCWNLIKYFKMDFGMKKKFNHCSQPSRIIFFWRKSRNGILFQNSNPLKNIVLFFPNSNLIWWPIATAAVTIGHQIDELVAAMHPAKLFYWYPEMEYCTGFTNWHHKNSDFFCHDHLSNTIPLPFPPDSSSKP